MKEENIGVLSAGERFGFKGFEWIVLDNNVDGGVLAIMASVTYRKRCRSRENDARSLRHLPLIR